jgi:hypothetical protein
MTSHTVASGFIPFLMISSQVLLPQYSLSQPHLLNDCDIHITAVAELSEPLPGAEVDLLYALNLQPVGFESKLSVDVFYGDHDHRNNQYMVVIEPNSAQNLQSLQLHSYGKYARVTFHHFISETEHCSVIHHSYYQLPEAEVSTSTTSR